MKASIGDWLATGAQSLADAGISDARLDSRLLLQHVLDLPHAALISNSGNIVEENAAKIFQGLLERRAKGEPVSRIVGYREFYGLRFLVTPEVLDPRPETELLVEVALKAANTMPGPMRILDIGTGSGAIAISLLHHLPDASCQACDISSTALALAAENARLHGVGGRFSPVLSDMIPPDCGRFGLIVSNPPYIETSVIASLDRGVRDHDPVLALDGGTDGLKFYRKILSTAENHLLDGGAVFLECGAGQAEPICQLARAHGWKLTAIHRDLSGIERVLEFGRT